MGYIVQNQVHGRSFNIAHCNTYEEAKELFEGRRETRRRLYPIYNETGCPTILQIVESDDYNIAREMNRESLIKRFHDGEITETQYKEQTKRFPSSVPTAKKETE